MIKKSILAAFVMLCGLSVIPQAAPVQAAEGVPATQMPWSFGGVFGTYDRNQLQRGFQVFREVCASCHSADLLAFRNLSEPGGPGYTDGQVRQLAAQYRIEDAAAEGGMRPGVPADRWPAPFPSERIARDSNNGAYPPDLSVIAKARGIHQDFPFWLFNYFTAYQEGGADFLYNFLIRYAEPPAGVEVGEGQYYNAFLGHAISMPQPMDDGSVPYEGEGVPRTLEQYAYDVSAFLMWVADPHMVARKELGFKVMLVLVLFAGLMYLVKRKIWANEPH